MEQQDVMMSQRVSTMSTRMSTEMEKHFLIPIIATTDDVTHLIDICYCRCLQDVMQKQELILCSTSLKFTKLHSEQSLSRPANHAKVSLMHLTDRPGTMIEHQAKQNRDSHSSHASCCQSLCTCGCHVFS